MTSTIIQSHGFDFTIQGEGFSRSNARDDFEKIVDRIGERLEQMNADEVGRLHAGALFQEETGEPVNESILAELTSIARQEAGEVLRGWHNPNGAFVSIAACK